MLSPPGALSRAKVSSWRDRILAFLLSQVPAGRISIPVWPKVWSFFHPPPTCRVGALAKVLRSRISDAYCPHLSSFVGLPSGPGAPLLVQGCSERTIVMLHPPLTLTQHSHSSSRAMTLRIFPGKKAGCECTTALWKETTSIWNRASVSQSVQSISSVWLFSTPWTAAHQASLSITNSPSLLKLMSMESVMPSTHLILCLPLLLPASGSPPMSQFFASVNQSIGASASESVLPMMNIQDWA